MDRVPRPSISDHVESGPDRPTGALLIHQVAAQSAPRPESIPLIGGQTTVERSKSGVSYSVPVPVNYAGGAYGEQARAGST